MKTTLRIGVCALAVFAHSSLVLAGPADDSVRIYSKTVRYSLSEVQTETGAKALYSQLRSAARYVCGDRAYLHAQERWALQSCTSGAVQKAVEQVNMPALDAVHRVRVGTIEVMAKR